MSRARKGPPDTGGPIPVISASEIGEYSYCSRAWWYRHVVKLPVPEGEGRSRLAAGTAAHRRHGSVVARGARLQVAGILLAAAGAVVLLLALVLR